MYRHLMRAAALAALYGTLVAAKGPEAFPRGALASAAQDTTFSPQVVALGEKIFQGREAGGLCFSCHGPNAKGTKGIAPNLTDANWLHGDGSYNFIVSTVESGVPKPKEAAAPMPPKGGAALTPDQVKAVAAYVYSLRFKKLSDASDAATPPTGMGGHACMHGGAMPCGMHHRGRHAMAAR